MTDTPGDCPPLAEPAPGPPLLPGGKRLLPAGPRLSGFVRGFVIADLLLCLLHGMLLAATWGGLGRLAASDPLRATAAMEIASGVGVFVFGLAGNAMILSRRPVGLKLAWAGAAFTGASIGVGVWQAWILGHGPGRATMEPGALIFTIAVAVFFRLALLGFYGTALILAGRQLRRQGPPISGAAPDPPAS